MGIIFQTQNLRELRPELAGLSDIEAIPILDKIYEGFLEHVMNSHLETIGTEGISKDPDEKGVFYLGQDTLKIKLVKSVHERNMKYIEIGAIPWLGAVFLDYEFQKYIKNLEIGNYL